RMVLSRDGRLCVTTSVDGRLDVRDVETGVRIYYQQAHNDQLFGAAFADDDSWVVVGGLDTRPLCRVYDLKTGAPLRDLEPPVGYTMFQLTPDSRMLVGGTFGGQIVAWDTATWSRLPPFVGHRAEVSGVVFNAAGTRMWSASHDATLIEWDVASRRPLRQARVHTAIVYSLALSPDERYIATGSHDQTAKLFDISGDEFREVHVLKGHRGNVRAVAFMPDGRHLLTASADATLRMHELATWREVRAWEPDDSEVAAVSVAPDGSFALVASAGTVRRLEFDYARQLEQRRDEAQTMRERVIRSRRDTQALLSLAGWYAWRDAPALALSLYEAVERAGAGGSVPTMALARACMQLGLNERAAGYLDRARAAGDIPPGYATALLGRLR
ncbi:MAG: WD40 repeat domain-containing protein, partial [Planctomycetota bacterium]